MPDNVQSNAASGGVTWVTDADDTQSPAVHWPFVKLAFGPRNTFTEVQATVGLPVQQQTNATWSQNVAQFGGTAVATGTGAGGAGIPRVTISNDSSLAANQSVNVAQINGVAPSMGNGVSGTGVQRVTLASDSTGQVALAAGSATIGALTANQSVNVAQYGGTNTTLGQKAMTASVPVVIASDQSAVPTSLSANATATYSAAITGLAPAASATDLFTITGSGTKTVKVLRVQVSGTATAAGAYDFQLIKRSTANSGGTSTSPAAVPHDTNDAAATATINAYTANPTLGTTVGTVRSIKGTVTTAAGAISNVPSEVDFNTRGGEPWTLRGTSQVLALNLNAATMTGGSVNIDIEWIEV